MADDKKVIAAVEQAWAKYARDKEEGWLRFMQDELKYKPDEKLLPVVRQISKHQDIAVTSSHGVGKTACGAVTVLTALAMTPHLVVVQVSPGWRQVKSIFWNEMRKWAPNSNIIKSMFEIMPKAPEMRCKLAPQSWYAIGVASDMPGTIEGFHGKRVMLIVDEAKAVKNQMFQAVEGALTSIDPERPQDIETWRAYFSTPSTPGGDYTEFYDAFKRNRKLFKQHKITAYESPRVNPKWVKMMIDKYGVSSPIVQAKVLAEFPEIGDDILIPLGTAERFYDGLCPPLKQGAAAMGIDVARFGMDESVITLWADNRLRALIPSVGDDTQKLAHKAWTIIKQNLVRVVVVDDIGVGGGVTDRLMELAENDDYEVQIVPFIDNARPQDTNLYKSKGDELWTLFAEALKKKEIQSDVDDQDLVYQLSSYKKSYTPDNKVRVIWPKRSDRSSERNSPDRGDAVVMGWYGQRLLAGANTTWHDDEDETDQDSDGVPEFGGIYGQQF